VLSPYQAIIPGKESPFVTKLRSDGKALVYSTFLGGSAGGLQTPETANAIAVDSTGAAYVTGVTSSTDFPVVNPYQILTDAGTHGFVAKLNPSGNALVYSTYLGGSARDWPNGIAVSGAGWVYVCGYTSSTDFPILDAIQTFNAGVYDAFLARLDVNGILAFSTFLGGSAIDSADALAIDGNLHIFLAGHTLSTDFPLASPFQAVNLGKYAAFLAKVTEASGQEIGSVDLAGNASGVGPVVKGSTLYVYGWAADTATGAPVQSVTVFVDGNSAGMAILGSARSDVANAYGRSDFTNSGWSFQMSTSALAVGWHTVTATVVGPSGTAPMVGSRTVNVTNQGQEIGSVDLAGNASGFTTVVKASTLDAYGWAADTGTGAPVQSVTVLVDGNSVGTATLGSVRSDVAQAYGRSDFTNSGWSFQMSTSALSVGTHQVTATAMGPSGTAPLVGSRTVNITTQGQEIGSVDLAGNASGVGTVGKGQTLYVFGWAADTAAGAPVQSVTVFVDGNSVGTATLGTARSDVASAFGRSDFTNSGWSFQISTSTLSLGQHTVTATAMGPSGTAQLSASRTVNITTQGQEIGSVDIAGNVNGNGTVTKGNTLFVFGWAADTATGAPVQSVTIFVDGGSAGTATLGTTRSDVASAYGRSDFTNSGWSFQMSTSALSLGQHSVTATAAGLSGMAQVGARAVTIQ
jgi:hypothetical protein